MRFRDIIGYEGEAVPDAATAPAVTHSLMQLAKATMQRIGTTVSGGPSVQSMLSSVQAQVSAAWWGLQKNVSGLATINQVSSVLGNLNTLASGVLVLTETGGTLALDASEQTAYLNNTPATIYRPHTFLVDTTNVSGVWGITYKEYYRIQTSGNLIQRDSQLLSGLVNNLWSKSLLPNRFGTKITLTGDAAVSGKTMDWEVFYEG